MADEGKQISGKFWRDDISSEHKAVLEQWLQEWEQEADHGERKGPFEGVALTGADVSWLAARTLAGTIEVQVVAQQKELLSHPPDDWVSRLKLNLDGLNLRGAVLRRAHLEVAFLSRTHLEGADLSEAHLEVAFLSGAHLEGAVLWGAGLEEADLRDAHLEGAFLSEARLRGAVLSGAHLEGAVLREAHLEGATLNHATFDVQTDLTSVVLTDTPHWYSTFLRRMHRESVYGPVSLADIRWNDVDLTVVDWSGVRRLDDESSRPRWWRFKGDLELATRANTQLARRLRDAGLNDDADRFAYRAQVCQRRVHRSRLRFGRWLFSWLLFVMAGYGYRPLRTLFWYLAVIFGFAFLYMHFGHVGGHPFEFDEALVFSVTSFHGRGFFPGTLDLKDLVTKLAASEAVFGLFIEVSFIATFTQRYFGK